MADKGCFKCEKDGRMSTSRECPSGGVGGGACHKCGEEGHMSRECPHGGGGDNKCRNCRQVKLDPFNNSPFTLFHFQVGHMATDCHEPEVCRRCLKEGHVTDDCPEPERCYNCRKDGHNKDDCPEEELCRRCRKPGHAVDDCPEDLDCTGLIMEILEHDKKWF